jgi:hypothetical protein
VTLGPPDEKLGTVNIAAVQAMITYGDRGEENGDERGEVFFFILVSTTIGLPAVEGALPIQLST